MKYKKYLIIISRLDKAGMNIGNQLTQFKKPGLFEFYLEDAEVLNEENLDLKRINEFDFIIFASKHASEKGGKTISIHPPGNWSPERADFGGKPGKVCRSSAWFQKQLFEILNKNMEKFDLRDYRLTLECTHHGPLISKPCVFVEIGATDAEWVDRRAGFVVAKSIVDAIEAFHDLPHSEVAIALGGPHYCPNFNKIQLNSNVAISHIIPEYSMPITEEMIKEAIEKTEEEIEFALIDWKGLGKSEDRDKVLKILDTLYVRHERTSEINKR